jgi:hypothetical protein
MTLLRSIDVDGAMEEASGSIVRLGSDVQAFKTVIFFKMLQRDCLLFRAKAPVARLAGAAKGVVEVAPNMHCAHASSSLFVQAQQFFRPGWRSCRRHSGSLDSMVRSNVGLPGFHQLGCL